LHPLQQGGGEFFTAGVVAQRGITDLRRVLAPRVNMKKLFDVFGAVVFAVSDTAVEK